MHPILLKAGPFVIHSYGVMILIGFCASLAYMMRLVRRRIAGKPTDEPALVTPQHIFDACVVGLFWGILGARVVFVLLDWPTYRLDPVEMLKIWNGGQSFIGAPLFGFTFLYWFSRRRGIRFLEIADVGAPGFALAYSIGRIGCLLNGCCYGGPCNLPWAIRFVDEHNHWIMTPPSHPTQIYSSIASLVMFWALDRWIRSKHRHGEVFIGYIGLYCIYRFIVEGFRAGATASPFMWGLTHAQAFCALMVPVAVVALIRLRRAAGEPAPTPTGPPQP